MKKGIFAFLILGLFQAQVASADCEMLKQHSKELSTSVLEQQKALRHYENLLMRDGNSHNVLANRNEEIRVFEADHSEVAVCSLVDPYFNAKLVAALGKGLSHHEYESQLLMRMQDEHYKKEYQAIEKSMPVLMHVLRIYLNPGAY